MVQKLVIRAVTHVNKNENPKNISVMGNIDAMTQQNAYTKMKVRPICLTEHNC